jgi:hypothetical protein
MNSRFIIILISSQKPVSRLVFLFSLGFRFTSGGAGDGAGDGVCKTVDKTVNGELTGSNRRHGFNRGQLEPVGAARSGETGKRGYVSINSCSRILSS